MKLALDVWYEAWDRIEGGAARAVDLGEAVGPPEAARNGALREPGGVCGREPVGDGPTSPHPGI